MYLRRKGGFKYLVAGIPCVVMLAITGWAIILNEMTFLEKDNENYLLAVIGGIVLVLAAWMTMETLLLFFGKSEEQYLPRNDTELR